MQTVEQWQWWITWAGKRVRTRHHATEADIRQQHPDAERVPGSCIRREVPSTPAEAHAAMYTNATGTGPGPVNENSLPAGKH
jgi:hypothetical protein